MWETRVRSLGWEDSHSSILAWRIPMDRGAGRATVHGVTQSRTRPSDWAQQQRFRKLLSFVCASIQTLHQILLLVYNSFSLFSFLIFCTYSLQTVIVFLCFSILTVSHQYTLYFMPLKVSFRHQYTSSLSTLACTFLISIQYLFMILFFFWIYTASCIA